MRRVIQGDLGPATLVPAGEAAAGDNPRLFLDEFEAAGYLRSQFLADPADMAALRQILDEAEQASMDNLSDEDVLMRLAGHLVTGTVSLIEGSVPGGGAGGGGGGGAADANKNAANAPEDAAKAAAPVKAEDETLIDVVIQLMYWNPVTGKPKAFPKGVKVNLVNNSSVIESRTTNDQGICTYNERKYTSEKPYLIAEFLFNEYIDLDKNELVSAGNVSPGDQRRLLRMPRMWDSTKEKKFVDNRGGRFSKGKLSSMIKGQQGSAGSPWKIQVDHGWEKLWATYTFYNPLAKKTDGVCYGGLLEVFNDAGMSGNAQVAGGTVIDKAKGLCYIGLWRKTARDKLHMKFRYSANAYLNMKKKAAARKVLTVSDASLYSYSGKKRRRYYPLPAEWRSKKQFAHLGKKRALYEVQIKKGISKGQPIAFCLDDFVLVDSGTPVAKTKDDPYTIFNNLMGIRDPHKDEPYFTKHEVSSNHFAASRFYYRAGKGSTEVTRVVAYKRDFYDLLNKRTTRGDIIGARAAVKDDHIKADQQNPIVSGAGNYTVHYFHDCAIYKGKPLAHLLVYWSIEFKKSTTHAPASAKALKRYKRSTLAVKVRHEGLHPSAPKRSRRRHKNYRMRPTRGATRTVKVCFHIEARKAQPTHTTITVRSDHRDFRDEMGLRNALFSESSYKLDKRYRSRDRADKLRFYSYTFAHELGHALGLDDEYLEGVKDGLSSEEIWSCPAVPRYDQYYPGMPFTVEGEVSMMVDNKALRLRHFWQYLCFINENAQVQRLLGNIKYRLEYPIRGGPTLRFSLKPRHKKYYEPQRKKESPGLTHGTAGNMDLFLYKIGKDETQRFNVKAGFSGFDSILVVRFFMHFAWPQNAATKAILDWEKQVAVLKKFQNEVSKFSGWNNGPAYTLDCASGDYRSCLIYFRPHYDLSFPNAPANAQFKIKVRPHMKRGTAAQNLQDIYKENLTGNSIAVTDKVKWPTVLRYMLGLKPISVTGAGAAKKITPVTTISEADLKHLSDWVKSQVRRDYTVKKH